ncbi:MAG: NAD-binding protein [Chloroflexi bacterium]|uniref:NAD-binding protein n=1 Tax=Candidatus Chlorohelix allophototropha TaxID=3003348 RepID=A0A8T7LVE6_9CHLR|nr:NAD-binding protein [Chloroflexota bacterium]WJW66719.1 NAD-binding protein [Chloroflexota bacterium L227-S17]
MQQITSEFDEKQLQQKPEREDDPSTWRDHIIICGLHNLGFRIVEHLRAVGLRLIVIDDIPDERFERRSRRMGIKFLREDSRNPEVLVEAGILGAKAVIACEDNDLENLEIILASNELVPGIRTVASFFNQKIGDQIAQAVANATVLSLSKKAGPSFIEACVNSSVLHLFNLHHDDIAVVEASVSTEGNIQDLYYPATPIKVRGTTKPPSKSVLMPPPDYIVKPGQTVVLAGQIEVLKKLPGVRLQESDLVKALNMQETPKASSNKNKKPLDNKARRFNRLNRMRKAVLDLIRDIEKPFRFALLIVGLIIMFSTVTLWFFYHPNIVDSRGNSIEFNLLDALYFTVTIIATVGFGDYSFVNQDWTLKVFGIMLILVGALSMSIVYAFVTNFVISRRIEAVVGRQKVRDMEGHVILCGLGTIGYQVMLGLIAQGKPVAVIEKSENGRFNSEAAALGVPVIVGDGRLPQMLSQLNVEKAKAIAVLSNDDLANLEIALNARAEFYAKESNKQKKLQIVLRVFDKSLGDRITKNFDIQKIYSASALAAPYFVAAALDYEVITTFYIDLQPYIVAKLAVQANSGLDRITIGDLYERKKVVVMSYIYENASYSSIKEPVFQPRKNVVLKSGDTIYIVGMYERVLEAYLLNKVVKQ